MHSRPPHLTDQEWARMRANYRLYTPHEIADLKIRTPPYQALTTQCAHTLDPSFNFSKGLYATQPIWSYAIMENQDPWDLATHFILQPYANDPGADPCPGERIRNQITAIQQAGQARWCPATTAQRKAHDIVMWRQLWEIQYFQAKLSDSFASQALHPSDRTLRSITSYQKLLHLAEQRLRLLHTNWQNQVQAWTVAPLIQLLPGLNQDLLHLIATYWFAIQGLTPQISQAITTARASNQ